MKDILVFWVSLFFVALIIFLMTGCTEKTIYVDRVVKVNVPVRCIAPNVNQSVQGKNDAESLIGIIQERDELRKAIEACR